LKLLNGLEFVQWKVSAMGGYRGVTAGLALIGLIGLVRGQACAESITMTIAVPGHSIAVGGNLVTSQSSTDFIVNTTALNQVLTGDGSALQFASLEAQSNFPGAFYSPVGAVAGVLSQKGLVQIPVGASGSTNVTITVSEDGFGRPYTAGGHALGGVISSTTATFENTAAGDSQQLTSIYNNGSAFHQSSASLVSTGPAPNSSSATVHELFVYSNPPPYSITNVMSIALSPNATAVSQDQFFGAAIVVPEPPGLLLLPTGLLMSLVTMNRGRETRRYSENEGPKSGRS
jgi:hypothetical protein